MSRLTINTKRPVFRNNFGAIRYILALAICLSHFNVLTGNDLYFPISGYYRVCSFFVMSGFLIYGSYYRSNDWKDYLKNRAWRILPSYLITVLGCAMMLFLISDFTVSDYFMSYDWMKYLVTNALSLNFLAPELPGVFQQNPVHAVNGSLWTMKVEWMLYLLVIPVIWITRKYKIKFWKLFIGILIFSVVYKYTFISLADTTGRNIYRILAKQMGGQLAFFYSGVFLYTYFDRIKPYKYHMAIISFIIIAIGMTWFFESDIFSFVLFPMSLASFVISIAYIGTWGRWAELFENCSYEIYLFHFPIIQTFQHFGIPQRIGALPAFIIIFSITCTLAYCVAKYISAPLRRSHRSSTRALNANVMLSECKS